MALRIIPVVHLSCGMFLLILFVAGHSLNKCHGVCSSMKHRLHMGSSLWIRASCLARKQWPVNQQVIRPKSILFSFIISFEIFGFGAGNHSFVCLQSTLPFQYVSQLAFVNLAISLMVWIGAIGKFDTTCLNWVPFLQAYQLAHYL